MKLLSILLFLVIAVSIFLVAVLANPDHLNNQYFWITVVWLIVLSGLNWFASTFIFLSASKSSSNQKVFGILPSINIIVFVYSLISGSLLISTWYVNDFGILPNSHLIIQIVLFAILSSITILMFIAAKAAQIDNIETLLSKEELTQILKIIQSIKNLSEDKNELIKELSELIKYSMPHLSKLNSKESYEQLVKLFRNKRVVVNADIQLKSIEKAILLAKMC